MILDYANPDSVTRCIKRTTSVLAGLRGNLRRNAATYNRVSPHNGDAMSLDTTVTEGASGLEVRLVSNADGELWFATGNVKYDTTHGAACESCELNPNDDDDALQAMATDLVNGVADQLAEQQDDHDDSAGAAEPGRCNE